MKSEHKYAWGKKKSTLGETAAEMWLGMVSKVSNWEGGWELCETFGKDCIVTGAEALPFN